MMLNGVQSIIHLGEVFLSEQQRAHVVFISLDFEFFTVDSQKIREIGISTLDIRDLSVQHSELGDVLQTQNLRWSGKRWSFLFGETKRIFPSEMRECLEKSIRKTDADGQPCKVVVVGHSVKCNLEAMRLSGPTCYIANSFLECWTHSK